MADTYRLGPGTVHRIGFGAMQLAGPGVFGPPRDRDEALAVLRRAVELGVNHIDTSQYYGPDVVNDLIREALFPYRDDLVLVSKVGARRDAKGGWLPWDRPGDLRQGIEDNLRSLEVERLGAVNLRLMDAEHASGVPLEDQLTAMVQAREDGLISGVGISNVSPEQFATAVEQTEIACVQNPYNLLDRSSDDVLRQCRERGIPFVPFFPLGSGFAGQNRVLGHPVLTAVAQRRHATPAQAAMAWLLAIAPNTLLIPGTSSLAHLEQNLAAADVELTAEDLAELDGAR